MTVEKVGALSAQVDTLTKEVDHSFSHLNDVAPKVEAAVNTIQAEYVADKKEYDKRLATYYQQYDIGSRILNGLGGFGAAGAFESERLTPLQKTIDQESHLLVKARQLAQRVAERSERVVPYYRERGGIAVVYNPADDSIHYKSVRKSGVAGVYNPDTKQIEWNEQYNGGVAGMWNPTTHKVEWRSASKSGMAVVWDPDHQKPVFAEPKYGYGVGGAWDPVKHEPHFEYAKNSGIAVVWNPAQQKFEREINDRTGEVGYYDEVQKKVVFGDAGGGGIGIAVRTKDGVVTASSDYGAIAKPLQDDEDDD
jgi:hypothetical protein